MTSCRDVIDRPPQPNIDVKLMKTAWPLLTMCHGRGSARELFEQLAGQCGGDRFRHLLSEPGDPIGNAARGRWRAFEPVPAATFSCFSRPAMVAEYMSNSRLRLLADAPLAWPNVNLAFRRRRGRPPCLLLCLRRQGRRSRIGHI